MNKKVSRVSAYGLLVRDEKIMLCRLSSRVMRSAGRWTLPGGGLDFGESPENGMVREFSEETGLVVKAGPLVAVDSLSDEVNGTHFHSVRILYKAIYVSGELQFEQEGTTDLCQWFAEQQALALPLIGLSQLGVRHAFS